MEPVDIGKYEFIQIPVQEEWGILVHESSPLARKESIRPEDIVHVPLLLGQRDLVHQRVRNWFGSLSEEMNVAAELIQKCIEENTRIAQDQTEYAKRYDALAERFDTAKAQLDVVQEAITKKQAQRKMMEHFMEELKRMPEMVDSFDEGAWYALVDYVTVCGKDDVRFIFKNGAEIRV